MKTSIRWLNRYLSPGDVSAVEAESVLMDLGFPSESSEAISTPSGPDTRLDVELTSNRGDCLSHVGLAREISARTGRTLVAPTVPDAPRDAARAQDLFSIENQASELCPLFTAMVIRGVKVGPSPEWLREALEAVGQRSINNVVDVTNYINFELGNPCHAFDLAKVAGRRLVIRFAHDKEPLTTLDGRKRVLAPDELVVADAHHATSLAGVIGGGDSEVSAQTTDVVLEVATWDPPTVRRAARRHQVRTDASHRFERYVDARTVEFACRRGAALIAQVSGGRVCDGIVTAGRALPADTRILFRPDRCRALIGIDITTPEMVRLLSGVGVTAEPVGRAGEALSCTVPPHRHDITREVDLIEEVARLKGLDAVPIRDRMTVAVRHPQPSELARRELASLLTGLGFWETVTFSFTTPAHAQAFCPAGLVPIEIADERRGEEPALRPSVIAGLLACRRQNQHGLVRVEGGVRLFEVAQVFAQDASHRTVEHTNLGLLIDAPAKGKNPTLAELQAGVRAMRGAVESLVRGLAGPGAALGVEPAAPHAPAFDGAAYARLTLNGAPLGYLGLIARDIQSRFDLAGPVVAAELNMSVLIAAYPPKGRVTPLPEFPGIERDVSLIVGEDVAWARIAGAIEKRRAAPLEGFAFVTTYRGAQVGKGRKSVTIRLSYRDPSRTLRHEEVDAPAAMLIDALKGELGAEVRA